MTDVHLNIIAMMGDSSQRFMLKAADGRMATYDTRFGPALTTNIALGYVWTEAAAAEAQLPLYEKALGTGLTVTPQSVMR